MNIYKIAFKSANLLTAATAALWVGSAIAAPLAPAYSRPSAARFASAMQDPAPADEIGSDAGLAADLQRQVVDYPTRVAAGTVVIDTAHTYLYYVLGNGKAIRYGIGVGRDGFTWSGEQSVTRKAEWPDWIPPQEMIARQPYLPRWMAGGNGNPLGARAIYLGNTVYRIHGTNMPADHRPQGVERLHPHAQRRRDRSLQPGERRHQNRRACQSQPSCHDRFIRSGAHCSTPHRRSARDRDLLNLLIHIDAAKRRRQIGVNLASTWPLPSAPSVAPCSVCRRGCR